MKQFLAATSMILVLASCSGRNDPPDFVVRLGDRYLTREELGASLKSLTVLQDSAEASRQIVEQWITDGLLFDEAVRRGLRNEEGVRKLLEENERSVLISALLSRLYEEEDVPPDEQTLITYYEQNKDRLRLTEPFVRVRYVVTGSTDSADAAVEQLAALEDAANPDSAWEAIAERFTVDPEGTRIMSTSYYPETRIFASVPGLNEAIERLSPGQVLSPFEFEGRFNVVQLVERLPVGAIPEMPLLKEQLRDRLTIENRKQLYARQVQRLRNEALAREDLVIR